MLALKAAVNEWPRPTWSLHRRTLGVSHILHVYGTACLSRTVAVLAASGIHMVMSWRYNFANVVSAVVCIATSAAKEIAEDVSSHSRPFR